MILCGLWQRLRRVRAALAAEPGGPGEANELARRLLICEPADMRDAGRALRPAREACAETGYKNPSYLDTLSLALHRTGDTVAAILNERKAVVLALGTRSRRPIRSRRPAPKRHSTTSTSFHRSW